MKTENLAKAAQSLDFACEEMRAAHHDAVDAKDAFAEMVLFGLIEEVAALRHKFNRANFAATLA